MPKRKLTERLREKIKKDYRKLKKSDFEGEALAYLNRVRGAAKGRSVVRKRNEVVRKEEKKKSRKESDKLKKQENKRPDYFIVDNRKLKKDSAGYLLIENSAKNKKVTPNQFIKKHTKEIVDMLDNYLVFNRKEIEYLRDDVRELPKSKKIFIPIKGGVKSKQRALFILHALKKTLIEEADIYDVVFIEYAYDLEGNLHIDVPQPGEYKEMDGEEILDYLDEHFPNITTISNRK